MTPALARRTPPSVLHLRLIAMQDPLEPRETTETIAPDTDRAERHTLPPGEADVEAGRVAATMLPEAPSHVPAAQELESSALAAVEPPEWFKASFIGQALTGFANDAEDLRKGRARQHAEVMRALSEQREEQSTALARVIADMETLARELSANLELLSGEFRRHRDASNERDAEQDGRLHELERKIGSIKSEVLQALMQAMPDAMQAILAPFIERIESLENELAALKTNEPARSAQAAPSAT
jgi:hypothetical protein